MNNTIADIEAALPTSIADMPKISSESERPNYTTLKEFQNKLDENALSIYNPTTDLGYLQMVIDETEFRTLTSYAPYPKGPYL